MRLTHSLLAATIVAGSAFLFAAARDDDANPKQDHAKAGQDHAKAKHESAKVKHESAKVGHAAPEFTLTGADGKTYNLADYKGTVVVLEWFCSSCTVSAAGQDSFWENGNAATTIAAVKAADPKAVYLTINSTKDGHIGKTGAEEGASSAAAIAKAGQSVPVLLDANGKVGKAYGAKTTPHFFIVDGTGNVAYIGAPMSDDGKTNYIVNAVTALKAGKPVEPSSTKNKGCSVKYAK